MDRSRAVRYAMFGVFPYSILEISSWASAAHWLRNLLRLSPVDLFHIVPFSLVGRALLVPLALFAVLYFVGRFLPRVRKVFLGAALFYVAIYTINFHPALLTTNSYLRFLYPVLEIVRGDLFFLLTAFALPFSVFIALMMTSCRGESVLRTGRALVFCAIVAFWTLWVGNPLIKPSLPELPRADAVKGPNLLLFGIDGLRPESLVELVTGGKYPSLQRFVTESTGFRRVLSPIARTHPVFHSIFHAKPPSALRIRTNNSGYSRDTDASLAGSFLQTLKESGYYVSLGISNSTYTSYDEGNVIDRVYQPPPGAYSLMSPELMRNPIFWALAANSLGEKLFPDLILNSDFSDTFDQRRYLNSVLHGLKETIEVSGSRPFFFLNHNTSLHWPGSVRDESFKCDVSTRESARRCFRYGGHYDLIAAAGLAGGSDIERNHEIYRRNVEILANEYLEPLFTKLYASGVMGPNSRNIVVLFSDHGEALFDKALLPLNKTPNHGSLLAFGDDSNEAALAIRFPGEKALVLEETFPLYDLFPYLVSRSPALLDRLSGDYEPKMSRQDSIWLESDRWIVPLFPGQWTLAPDSNLLLYDIDNRGRFFLKPVFEEALIARKSYRRVDARSGKESVSGEAFISAGHGENGYSKLIAASDALYRDFQLRRAMKGFEEILGAENLATPLREFALAEILRACVLFGEDRFGDEIGSILSKWKAEELGFEQHLWLMKRCHGARGEQAEENRIDVLIRRRNPTEWDRYVRARKWMRASSPPGLRAPIDVIEEPTLKLSVAIRRMGFKLRMGSGERESEFEMLARLVRDGRLGDLFEKMRRIQNRAEYSQLVGLWEAWYVALLQRFAHSPRDKETVIRQAFEMDSRMSLQSMFYLSRTAADLRPENAGLIEAYWKGFDLEPDLTRRDPKRLRQELAERVRRLYEK